jgi:hypothetical protein
MNINSFNSLNIVAVRFYQTGDILTANQFISWTKVNTLSVTEDVMQTIFDANAEPVYSQDPPAVNINQLAEWDGAIQKDGKWYRNWKIIEVPDRELELKTQKLAELRFERNALLSKSDWTQVGDSPLSLDMKEKWATYRQELRNITTQNIDAVIWPIPPASL